jgi:hypothetical protein
MLFCCCVTWNTDQGQRRLQDEDADHPEMPFTAGLQEEKYYIQIKKVSSIVKKE